MADNFEQATVTPYIPKKYITEDELLRLEEAGFSFDECKGPRFDPSGENPFPDSEPMYYLYVESSIYDEDDVWAIFQGILNRMPSDVPAIIIEGACFCTKMRQGEFGGWAVFVTREDIDFTNTGGWIAEKLRQEKAK